MNSQLRLSVHLVLRLAGTAVLLAGLATPSFAGSPAANCQPAQPFLWAGGGANIPFNPDQGPLGPLSNAEATALVADAFSRWADIPSASTTFASAGPLPEDVDIDNFFPYLFADFPDGLSAVVFDDTGEIFDLLFGPGSGVLGFAGPEWVNTATCQILEGLAFLNGPAFADGGEALDILVHEFGHYQNLDHTAVNGQLGLGDHTGPSPNDTFPFPGAVELIETMYPLYFGPGFGFSTPHKDDVTMLSTLYPAPGFAAGTGTITGRIFAPDGTTPLTGVNVIARNVADPFADAVSSVSSDLAVDFTPGAPQTGVYTLRGLTPGAQYAIFVDEILEGDFTATPLNPLPGPEEFYSGAGESSNGATDVPTASTPVTVAAGATQSGVNVIFNSPAAGAPLPVGDDGFVQLSLPFAFDLCGQRFTSVFVNANGNLTFGVASADFSESLLEFVGGPPRIAGLWDDLDPSSGGSVFFNQTSNTFTVTWQDVPEFLSTSGNTFSIKLQRSSNHVDIDYGTIAATDGLAGASCGVAITSGFERVSDLSRENGRQDLKKQPAIFEVFGPGNLNDLDGERLKFNAKATFSDRYESNNTLAWAKRIHAPFETADLDRFTKIDPVGGDVDFFKLDVEAGEILAVEVVRGGLDTLLGLFDADTGELLAVDDDGGNGLLSRILVQANEDLDVVIGVTTFPDVDFTGAGESGGRYVLAVHTYEGTVLPAGDDTSDEVAFTGFSFPFQGTDWSSVFVNSNGNLTFGAGSTDFSPSVAEFLAGPPRIAPRWDDLDAGDGLIIAEAKDDKLLLHYVSVPEFFSTAPNYFTVELDEDGDVEVEYFATNRTDGLAGVTQGGGAADPGETNLSREDDLSAEGTTYELFSSADVFSFDLFFQELDFEADDHHGHGHGHDDD